MIDKEQMIEDLHFLSDQGNYKSIKYAIECIDELEKIEQIMNKESEGYIQNNPCLREIKEVLQNDNYNIHL